MTKGFSGRHMAMILAGFFGVVVLVNIGMARLAHSTFGGVVVENSYVASQHFNRWLEQAEKDRALGWSADVAWLDDGRVSVRLNGIASGASVDAVARHPLGRLADHPLDFVPMGDGRFLSASALPAGRWQVRLQVQSGGQNWRAEKALP